MARRRAPAGCEPGGRQKRFPPPHRPPGPSTVCRGFPGSPTRLPASLPAPPPTSSTVCRGLSPRFPDKAPSLSPRSPPPAPRPLHCVQGIDSQAGLALAGSSGTSSSEGGASVPSCPPRRTHKARRTAQLTGHIGPSGYRCREEPCWGRSVLGQGASARGPSGRTGEELDSTGASLENSGQEADVILPRKDRYKHPHRPPPVPSHRCPAVHPGPEGAGSTQVTGPGHRVPTRESTAEP